MARVSVIVPTYNCERYLVDAIDSALGQTFRDFEIVVADDGSTDGTRELVERWGRRIVYAYQENRGLSSARNLAVSRASGEFLAYLDADDVWLPTKLATQIAYMSENPLCGLVHGEVLIIDEDNKCLFQRYNAECRRIVHSGHCIEALVSHSTIVVPSVMERRSCFEEVGQFDERLRSVEDYLHWVQIALKGHAFGYIDEPVAKYRWRRGSLSRKESKMAEAMILVSKILLSEWANELRELPDVRRVLEERAEELERTLPYVYRKEGSLALARKQAIRLIGLSPLSAMPYIELAKSLVPKRLVVSLIERSSAIRK